MASVRRKYQSQLAAKDEPPVTTTPQETAAKLPEPAVDAKPPEPIETASASPAEEAGKAALRQRLQEMERAEQINREAVQQHLAAEPQEQRQPTFEEAIAHLPERIQRWCRADPRLASDPERIAQAQYCHHVVRREVGEEFTDNYYDRMEQMLGLREQPKPQPKGKGAQQATRPQHTPAPAPRAPDHSRGQASAPARQYAGPPVSAPPTRETPSYTTGRPIGRRAPLTTAEIEIARSSGISPEEYAANKERMERMKQSGQIQ